jgi:hypothetical protein
MAMGMYSQLSLEQREVAHKIYMNIGLKPFKSIEHRDIFNSNILLGLKIKGVIKKHGKKKNNRGNFWILTDTGVKEAKRFEKIMSDDEK